ncbi:MAG: hypothetical protein D6731_21430 [Planctomycetota bacterium]|nr:MAG: hypothetical protein D6731_21430 [Planctomycetota bacterium]
MRWPLEERVPRYELALSLLCLALAATVGGGLWWGPLADAREEALRLHPPQTPAGAVPLARAQTRLRAELDRERAEWASLANSLRPAPVLAEGRAQGLDAVERRLCCERLCARLPQRLQDGVARLAQEEGIDGRVRVVEALLSALEGSPPGPAALRTLLPTRAQRTSVEGPLVRSVVRHGLRASLELRPAELEGFLRRLGEAQPPLFVERLALEARGENRLALDLEVFALDLELRERVRTPAVRFERDEGWSLEEFPGEIW